MINLSVIWTFIKLYIQAYTTKPTKVRLDLCNMCQLNCVECSMRKKDEKIKAENGFGYVKFETFKNFVDAHPFIKGIEIAANGGLKTDLKPPLARTLFQDSAGGRRDREGRDSFLTFGQHAGVSE